MGGASPLTIEHIIANSEPSRGLIRTRTLSMADLRLADGSVPTTTSDPKCAVASDEFTIQWGAADTDAILLPMPIPDEFAGIDVTLGGTAVKGKLTLIVLGVVSGIGSQNADLALVGTLRRRGKTATAITAALAASAVRVNGTAEAAPAGGAIVGALAKDTAMRIEYDFDIEDYDWGDALTLKLVPNEAIGTNLTLTLRGLQVRVREHVALADRDERGQIF